MASLKETIMKANRDKSGKSSKAIRKAAEDRLKFKKKGGKTRNTLAEDAEKAVEKADQKETRKVARADAKKDAAAKKNKKPAKKKKVMTTIAEAARLLTVRKNKNKQ